MRRAVVITAVALCLFAAGCGDDTEASGPTAPPTCEVAKRQATETAQRKGATEAEVRTDSEDLYRVCDLIEAEAWSAEVWEPFLATLHGWPCDNAIAHVREQMSAEPLDVAAVQNGLWVAYQHCQERPPLDHNGAALPLVAEYTTFVASEVSPWADQRDDTGALVVPEEGSDPGEITVCTPPGIDFGVTQEMCSSVGAGGDAVTVVEASG